FENEKPIDGTWNFKEGDRYVGKTDFDGKATVGTYYWPNGQKFEGSFQNQQPTAGSWHFPNGDVFSGSFRNFNFAEGSYRSHEGWSYSGRCDANGRPTNGTYKAADGGSRPLQNGSLSGGEVPVWVIGVIAVGALFGGASKNHSTSISTKGTQFG